MIFYIVSNTHSKFADKQFNEQLLGSSFVTRLLQQILVMLKQLIM